MHSLADPNNTVPISMFYLLVYFLSKYTGVYTEKNFKHRTILYMLFVSELCGRRPHEGNKLVRTTLSILCTEWKGYKHVPNVSK